jgi:hypothetical protein
VRGTSCEKAGDPDPNPTESNHILLIRNYISYISQL